MEGLYITVLPSRKGSRLEEMVRCIRLALGEVSGGNPSLAFWALVRLVETFVKEESMLFSLEGVMMYLLRIIVMVTPPPHHHTHPTPPLQDDA